MEAERTVAEQPVGPFRPSEAKMVAGTFLCIVAAYVIGAVVGWWYEDEWAGPVQSATAGGIVGVVVLCFVAFAAAVCWGVVMSVRILLS